MLLSVQGDVGVTSIDGCPIAPNVMVTPCLSVLPMGFAFALHWAQKAHEQVLVRAGVARPDQFLFDFAPPPDLTVEAAQVVYVDNGVFACCVSGVADEVRARAARALEDAGLPVHEVTTEGPSACCWSHDELPCCPCAGGA